MSIPVALLAIVGGLILAGCGVTLTWLTLSIGWSNEWLISVLYAIPSVLSVLLVVFSLWIAYVGVCGLYRALERE